MEIKFFDRLKALDKLGELVSAGEEKGTASFYEALEKSAAKTNAAFGDEGYE